MMGTPQLHATTCKCTSAYWVWICRYTIYEHALRTSGHVPCCFSWFMMPCIFWLLLRELTCCRCARNLQQSKCPKPYSLKFEIRTSRKTIHFDRGCMRGNSLYRNVVQHTNSWHSCNYTCIYIYIHTHDVCIYPERSVPDLDRTHSGLVHIDCSWLLGPKSHCSIHLKMINSSWLFSFKDVWL